MIKLQGKLSLLLCKGPFNLGTTFSFFHLRDLNHYFNSQFLYSALSTCIFAVSKRLAYYYRCHLRIVVITLRHHLGGSLCQSAHPIRTLYDFLTFPPFNSSPNIARVNEAIVVKCLAQGAQDVGPSGARTHNLMFMSPALFR